MNQLVLSLFPGIGLLDMAFEEEGFCVVRGPDVLWGGDIRNFHPPVGKFDGVIGGPPCQVFSQMRHMNPKCGERHGNLIPEFCRVVCGSKPEWFVMENVPDAPEPSVDGYGVKSILLRDVWVGGQTSRLRRFSFGVLGETRPLNVELLALHSEPKPAVMASAGVRPPVKLGGSGKIKRKLRDGYREKDANGVRLSTRDQGLPDGFLDESPFTVSGKLRAIGNGVPLPMGRAIARAVKGCVCPIESCV